jgi:hypothetical protein
MGDRQNGDGKGRGSKDDGDRAAASAAADPAGDSAGAVETGDLGETLADLLGGEDVGALLIGQLSDLIESWAKVIEVVAEHGVDPTPLLRALVSTLRATADELDPSRPTT